MHLVWNVAVWVLMVAVAVLAGRALLKALRVPAVPFLDTVALSLGLGLGLLAVGVSVLGWFGLFQRSWVVGWFSAVGILGLGNAWYMWAKGIRWGFSDFAVTRHASVYPAWMYLLPLAAFAAVYFAYSMTPPLEGDTLHSYLDVPRQLLEAGGIVPLPYELHAPVPLNVQMLSVLSLSLSGDDLAQMAASATMAIGAAGVVFVLGRRFLSAEAGLLGALVFLTMYVVQYLVPSAKANLGWVFWDLLAVYCIACWAWDSPRKAQWLLAGGVFSGLAIGSLYSGGITALLLGVGVLAVVFRQGVTSMVRTGAMYAAPALLLSGGWFLRNWSDTGNPVYPMFNSAFGIPNVELAEYSGHSLIGLLTAPWRISTGYIVGSFGHPVGPLVLGGIPALALAGGLSRKVLIALGFVACWYLLWYFGVQRPRNMLTILGILSIAGAAGYLALAGRSRLVKFSLPVLLGGVLAFSFAFYARDFMLVTRYGAYTLGLESREAFLARNLRPDGAAPTVTMLRAVESLPESARVVGMYTGNGYYVSRPFIDSRLVDSDFSQDTANGAADLIFQWRSAGITHVFISEGYLARASTWGTDLDIVRSGEFASMCLKDILDDRGQRLFLFSC
ncbi:MAG: hypothetical protein HY681_12205 [Chloroflexi bacterium]|nr:hypothetical protein [Chloroflexota bacterium]